MKILCIFLFGLGMIIAPESPSLYDVLDYQEIIQCLQINPAVAHANNTCYKKICEFLVPQLIVSCQRTSKGLLLNIRDQSNVKYQILLPGCEFPLKEDVSYNIKYLDNFYYSQKLDEDVGPKHHDPQFILRPYQPNHDINAQFSQKFKEHMAMFSDNIYKLTLGFYYHFKIKKSINLQKLIELFVPMAKTLHDKALPGVADLFAEHWKHLVLVNYYDKDSFEMQPVTRDIIRKLAKYVARLRYDYIKVRMHVGRVSNSSDTIEAFAGGIICDDRRQYYGDDPEIDEYNPDQSWTEVYFEERPTLDDYDDYDDPEELEVIQSYWDLLYSRIKSEYERLLDKIWCNRHKAISIVG